MIIGGVFLPLCMNVPPDYPVGSCNSICQLKSYDVMVTVPKMMTMMMMVMVVMVVAEGVVVVMMVVVMVVVVSLLRVSKSVVSLKQPSGAWKHFK